MNMKFKVKPASLIISLVLVATAVLFIPNDSNAQDKTYEIGDRGPAGGWIFYDKGYSSDGWRYLEAAPVDQSVGAEWMRYSIMSSCCLFPSFYFREFGGNIPGAQGTAIGTGKSNTQAIVKSSRGEQTAAQLCIAYRGGGKSDWFLPSIGELKAMYANIGRSNFRYVDDCYWSSSQQNSNSAWYWYFDYGRRYSNENYYDRQRSWGMNYKGTNTTCRVRAVRAFDSDDESSEQTVKNQETSANENRLPNRELLLGVDYSGYDTLTKLKAKNPDITFSQIKYPYENKGRTQFKTVLGQSPITTEATFTFNSKGRLVNVIIKKKGAALDVYEPLVEKYTQIYGNPKSSTPFTTDLRQNASFATCSWENEERDTLLLLIIPLDGYSVPSIKLVENWKDK